MTGPKCDTFAGTGHVSSTPLVSAVLSVDSSATSSPCEQAAPIAMDVFDRVKLWRSVLCVGADLVDLDVFSISLDQPNQRVISYDCDRTRASLPEFKTPEVRVAMEAILTHYCSSQNIKYKQGMNEVLAPFVYLKCLGEISTWSECFCMYFGFISKFLPDLFIDEEFVFLQKVCLLFKTLLCYHAPALSARLDSSLVTPEMYVTPWFLTIFASKTSLPAIFALWDNLILHGDKHSPIFLGVSLCVAHARVLRSSSKSSLPETITKISLTEDSVLGTWRRSLKIRVNTPPYFIQQLANAAEFLVVDPLPIHVQKQVAESGLFPLLISPYDLFRNANLRYLVLDCRPSRLWKYNTGTLPLAVPFDLESLVESQTVFPVADAFRKLGEIVGVFDVADWPVDIHICLMGFSDSQIDAIGLLFVALVKFSAVPRISIVKGGFEAIHSQLVQELVDHDASICNLCTGRPRAPSSDGSPSVLARFRSFVSESSVGRSVRAALPHTHTWITGQVSKCLLLEVMGRASTCDSESNAGLVITETNFKCVAPPTSTLPAELAMYANWQMRDLVKITTKTSQPNVLLIYFSHATTPDLVVALSTPEAAKTIVDDVRHKYRLCKK